MRRFDYAQFGDAGPVLQANVRKVGKAMAGGLRPPPRMSVAEWAERYRRFPDDDAFPGAWRHDTAPYLVEIMDALSSHDPCEEVVILKCAQSGGTAAIENWLGYIADIAPGPVLFVQATFRAALDWAAEKLWPMIEATPRLSPDRKGAIKSQKSPDGDGSTKNKVRFARSNGYILLSGANSAPSLRQRTVRYAVEDDFDQQPDDLDGQGDPSTMVDNRLKVWRRRGQSKRAKISTPTIKGASKIGRDYATSDRRRYHLACPQCRSRFVPEFADLKWAEGVTADTELPTPCCGYPLQHWEKAKASLPDGWLSDEIDGEKVPRVLDEAAFYAARARMPQSRKRGFHITGRITSFQTWADLTTAFLAAQGDVNKLRTWTNLDDGEEFELKAGVPDYEKLRELREQDWGKGTAWPVGAVASTMGVDVQGDGLYFERLLWGENAETWQLDCGFLPGATDIAGEGAWIALDQIAKTPIVYPGGLAFPLDQVCVDAGYHTAAAEGFCRSHARRLPVFGRWGWHLPVLGRGETIRYERQGKKAGQATKKAEDKAYVVGTFGVKSTFYGYLRGTLISAAEEKAGALSTPRRGRCHWNRDAPDDWFEQATAESVMATVLPNGLEKREWKTLPGRQNHYLDCRVYNHAAAEKLMLDTLTEAQWAQLRAERYAAKDPAQGDLLAYVARPVAPASDGPAPAATPQARGFIDDPGEDYL